MTKQKIPDRYVDGHVQRRVDMLRIGDRVDLENDKFADPNGTNESPLFEFLTVGTIERETRGCIRIDFDNYSCGFPPNHWVDVDGEQVRS